MPRALTLVALLVFGCFQACRNKKGERRVIYLLPLGKVHERWPKLLEKMREYASIFFDCDARVLDPQPMLDTAYRRERDQYDADVLIQWMTRRVPRDGLILGGITDEDLFSDRTTFVFGLGHLERRCGAYSLVRMQTEDETLFLKRALNIMAHEFGPILSITHCVVYHCVMCGSGSLAEFDRGPMYACPIDLKKLQWNLGFDVKQRYRKLEKFYRDNGLTQEAEWTARQLKKGS